MAESPYRKKYDDDHIDFIIPFLINESVRRLSQQAKPTTSKSRRISVAPTNRQTQQKEIQELSRIYAMNHHKTFRKKIHFVPQQPPPAIPTQQQEISNVSADLKMQPSKSLKLHRFLKTKSHKNHPFRNELPADCFEKNQSHRVQPLSKQREESPILGVCFRKNNNCRQQSNSECLENSGLQGSGEGVQWESFKGDIKKKVKYMRQRKQWEKHRGINVDFIVNRNCANFQDLIQEYSRRMQLGEGSQIFVFDSRDLWMKRVLIDRGWVQNQNKASKAFHLLWSNKVHSGQLFGEQLCNHYPKSYCLTTKTGLQKMLKKYDLNQLQPPTFDLTDQQEDFLIQYNRRQFACQLQQFLSKFDFEDPEFHLTSEEVLAQIDSMIEKWKERGEDGKRGRQKLILQVLTICKSALGKELNHYDSTVLDQLQQQIRSTPLNQFQQEGVRVLRDFRSLAPLHNHTIGSRNFWLTKSKISSKGVGITLHNDLYSILKFSNRLVQKYIENPLIFQHSPFESRKFDLRVWVLVVGSRPSIYYHQLFYGRLCSERYSLGLQQLNNQSVHLTNFALNKQNFSKSRQLQTSIVLPHDLFQAIQKQLGFEYESKFHTDVQRMLKKLSVIFRKEIAGKQTPNCFELLGVDLILDASLHMHLLEVNLSAACQERHPSLSRMLEQMGHGIANILEGRHSEGGVDLRGWVPIE